MNAARTFRDLRVYQLARAASLEIFEASKSFPREEGFSLTDQVRRSSRATKAMISEAWGRRRYKAIFVMKRPNTDYRVKEELPIWDDLFVGDSDAHGTEPP